MLALIAGQGDLPARIAARCAKWPLIAALDEFPPDELIPEITFRLETLGTLLQTLAERGVHQVCFAGAIRRPKVEMARVDMATAPLVPRVMGALAKGDDGALRVVIDIFQDAGFSVVGVDELVPDFLPDAGVPTKQKPSAQDKKDIARATDLLIGLSEFDVGQGCVVANGQVLAIETFGGTDWMLNSVAQGRGSDWPTGGVLLKMPKEGQDRRIDLPTIGRETVQLAVKAGLAGIAIAEGGVMVLNPEQVIESADSHRIFLSILPQTP